jgi:predicted small lipoprotein YifL
MKKTLASAALLLPLAIAGCGHPAPVYYPPPPPPPPAFSQFAQQGYHDGVIAAQRDIRQGRPPNVAMHPRFRRPPVPPPAIDEYQRGFRNGYDQVFRHGGPPPPPPGGYPPPGL